MKNLFFCLTLLLFVSGNASAQFGWGPYKDFTLMKENKITVMLENSDTAKYNTVIQPLMKEFWNFCEVEYMNKTELDAQMKTDRAGYYMVKTMIETDDGKSPFKANVLCIVRGGKNIKALSGKDMLAIFVLSDKKRPGDYKLRNAVQTLNLLCTHASEDKKNAIMLEDMETMFNERATELEKKFIYIINADLPTGFDSLKVTNIIGGKVRIRPVEEFIEAVETMGPNTVYLSLTNFEGTALISAIDAKDGTIYYLRVIDGPYKGKISKADLEHFAKVRAGETVEEK